ncbi:MAG TPA: PfkB family carbohydrate kinase [Candidatus Dormibacteraeota bacterium]
MAAALRADGVSLELASFSPEPTPVALAEPDGKGGTRYRFTVAGTAAANLTPDLVPQDLGPAVTALHVGSLGLVLEPIASTLLALVERERGRRLIVVDPNIRPGLIDDGLYRSRLRRVLELSAVVKASAGDLDWLFPGVAQAAVAEQLLKAEVRLVVITLGVDGAFAANRRAQTRVPAPAVQVVDTIGAGDAFGAGLLAWLHDHQALDRSASLDGDQLRELLEFSCAAAAVTVSNPAPGRPRSS